MKDGRTLCWECQKAVPAKPRGEVLCKACKEKQFARLKKLPWNEPERPQERLI